MEFTYVMYSRDGKAITHRCEVTLSDNEITFKGKGAYGQERFDLDDKIIDSISSVYKKKYPNIAPSIDVTNAKKWRVMRTGSQEITAAAGILHGMDNGKTSFTETTTESPKLVKISDVIKEFLEKNKDQIRFNNEGARKEAEEKYSVDLTTTQELAQKQAIQEIINKQLSGYKTNTKERFFSTSEQRSTIIQELNNVLKPLFEQRRLTDEDKKTILTSLLEARNNVKQSHAQFNLLASAGVTKSYLGELLKKIINNLVQEKIVKQEDVDTYTQELANGSHKYQP